MNSGYCEYAQKVAFSSVAAARKSLTGQLRSKRVRVYPCLDDPSHYHLTKEGAHKFHDANNA